MVQMRYVTGTSSTHVTDVCKPGMPQICQQLTKRETEETREGEREREADSLSFALDHGRS